ncbi:hypothetical protein H8E06_00555 [bacterium]|nr:hypothetical protein [bacterium]
MGTDYTIPETGYATFDALSMKELIKGRLRAHGFYTDQDFEGSNLSSLIDMVAYSYHVQMFYLNQTSNESLFTEAQLYENVNRIVKFLGYKPKGFQTCQLGFTLTGLKGLKRGAYAIPKYTYVTASGVQYCAVEDMFISKSTTDKEQIKNITDRYTLYQGIPQEYPQMVANGDEFETAVLLPGEDVTIDHSTISVYVKNVNTEKWEQWYEADTLYNESSNSPSFDLRLNENFQYELKFGNNVTGRKLNTGDTIAIYYISSDGTAGKIGPNTIGKTASLYTTPRFIEIFNDIKNPNTNYIDSSELKMLEFNNSQFSTEFFERESVASIKENAPNIFSSQNRAITKADYESFINYNFANTIKSVKVVNNETYLTGHLKYMTDKLNATGEDVTTLYNQLQFADSTNFNNTYIYAVPRQETVSSFVYRYNYLSLAQKNKVLNKLKERKTLTSELVMMDPVYMASSFGVALPGEKLYAATADKCKLIIQKDPDSPMSEEGIINKVYQILKSYFDSATLGYQIDINSLTSSMLNISGVVGVKTQRTDNANISINGLSLLMWNPIYRDSDINVVNSNITLPYYKYPYVHDVLNISDKIEVVTATTA